MASFKDSARVGFILYLCISGSRAARPHVSTKPRDAVNLAGFEEGVAQNTSRTHGAAALTDLSTDYVEMRASTNRTQGWTAGIHALTWFASAYAYTNSNCPNGGKGKTDVPCDGGTILEQMNPDGGGPGGIAFSCPAGRVVAFRGTDLPLKGASKGGACMDHDLAADHDLFDLKWIKSGPDPGIAKNTDSGTGAAYLQQALDFVAKHQPHVVTGHSLGAGLSILVASKGGVAPSMTFGFAAPPVDISDGGEAALAQQVNVMHNSVDPVTEAVNQRGNPRIVNPCVTADGKVGDACAECNSQLGEDNVGGCIWAGSAECNTCWPRTHTLGPYSPKVAGPTCTTAAVAPHSRL